MSFRFHFYFLYIVLGAILVLFYRHHAQIDKALEVSQSTNKRSESEDLTLKRQVFELQRDLETLRIYIKRKVDK